jgi:hypothetical protein
MSDYSWIPAVVGGVLGDQKAGALDAKQQELLERIYDELRNIPLPELERIQAEQMGPSAMEGVRSDPEQRLQQLQVMEELRNIFEGGGFNVEDKADLNRALNEANVKGNAQRQALAGEFAQRGQLGAGARLAMGNMDAQGAANRANQSALDVAAQGQRRKMDALGRYGNMAASLRGQDFGEGSARAQAADAASRWNAAAREKAGYYNAGLNQQQFNNQVSKATGAQGAGNNLSNLFGARAKGTRARYDAYGRAISEAMSDDDEGRDE